MKKIILQYIIVSIIIILLFKYNIDIRYNLSNVCELFIKKIIPSMFPIIFLTNYIKHNIVSNNNSKLIKYLSLVFSYVPSNAIIAKSNKELVYSSVVNPLFSYTILINYFSLKQAITIILINALVHYVLLFKNITINIKTNIQKFNINQLIKETTLTIINIFGVIIFFNIFISLLNIFIDNKFLFFIEITNGFNIINTINNSIIKKLLFIFLNSFGGVAIFFQIKSINNDANYKYFLYKFVLSIFVSLLTYLIIL